MNKKNSQTSRFASFSLKHFSTITLASASLLAWFPQASAADVTKANNTNDLDLGTSWALGTAPTSSDVAVWNDTVVGANSSGLGATVNWQGIRVEGSTQTGLITADLNTFGMTLGSAGIDLSASPRNLTIREGTLTVGANQTWNVGTGRTLTIGVPGAGSTTLLSGSGNVLKTGSGTVALNAATTATNTFTGNLTVSSGTLSSTGILFSTSGNLYLNDGARIENGGGAVSTITQSTGSAITHLAGTITFVGTNGGTSDNTRLVFSRTGGEAVNLTANTTVNVANAVVGPSGTIGGRVAFGGLSGSSSHSLTKTGIGLLVIDGNSTYGGNVFVNEGTLDLGGGSGNRLNGSSVTIDGGTLRVSSSANQTIGALTLTNGVIDGFGTTTTLSATSYSMVNGSVSKILAGSGALSKTGSGTVNLTAANTYTGATTVGGGTLQISGTGGINSTSGVTVNSGGNFSYSSSTALNRNVTVNTGGTFTHNGSSAYSGTLTWNGGTLAGTNFSGVSLTVDANKTLSPGNSPGTMATASQTWLDGGNYNLQTFDFALAPGTGFDTIAITGSLDLTGLTAGGFNINLWSLSSIGPDVNGNALNFDNTISNSWLVVSTTAGITGFDAANFTINTTATNGTAGFSNALDGGAFSVSQIGNDLYLNFSAIPEPNAIGLLAAGLTLLTVFRKRKQL